MIEVKNSKCYCGKCGEEFDVEWELEILDVSERPMGEQIEYVNDAEWECPQCSNLISASLYVCEYPIGALEHSEVRSVCDSENTEESIVEKPVIAFFDL